MNTTILLLVLKILANAVFMWIGGRFFQKRGYNAIAVLVYVIIGVELTSNAFDLYKTLFH